QYVSSGTRATLLAMWVRSMLARCRVRRRGARASASARSAAARLGGERGAARVKLAERPRERLEAELDVLPRRRERRPDPERVRRRGGERHAPNRALLGDIEGGREALARRDRVPVVRGELRAGAVRPDELERPEEAQARHTADGRVR